MEKIVNETYERYPMLDLSIDEVVQVKVKGKRLIKAKTPTIGASIVLDLETKDGKCYSKFFNEKTSVFMYINDLEVADDKPTVYLQLGYQRLSDGRKKWDIYRLTEEEFNGQG